MKLILTTVSILFSSFVFCQDQAQDTTKVKNNAVADNAKNAITDTKNNKSVTNVSIAPPSNESIYSVEIKNTQDLYTNGKFEEAKNKNLRAPEIKSTSAEAISKINKIDSIIKVKELAKVDSLLKRAENLKIKGDFENALIVFKNTLLKSNQQAIDGIDFCNSKIQAKQSSSTNPVEENSINIYEYLFYIVFFLALGLFILLLLIFKRMDKYKSKYSEAKTSLVDSIEGFKNTIISFNSLLKSLGKEDEIVSKYNDVKCTDELPKQSIEEIFQDLNYDLNNIAKQAKEIETTNLKNDSLLKKIEDDASIPVDQLAERYKETVLELNKAKEELKLKTTNDLLGATLSIPQYEVPKDVYINSNILVSPGPRKDKDNDTELGEDATGVFNTTFGTFFWILDGTSDSPSIINGKEHIFSSRILAQLMNSNIREQLIKNENSEINLKTILLNSVEACKRDLNEKLKKSPNDIHKKILSGIKSNNNPYCSTTVLIGFLSKKGDLRYFYLGDSEVLSFYVNGNKIIANAKDKNDNPSRLFISIVSEEDKIKLKTNSFDEKLIIVNKENVDFVVAFSDGIGTSEKALLVNPLLSLSKISLVNQLTYDDKTLLILERVTK